MFQLRLPNSKRVMRNSAMQPHRRDNTEDAAAIAEWQSQQDALKQRIADLQAQFDELMPQLNDMQAQLEQAKSQIKSQAESLTDQLHAVMVACNDADLWNAGGSDLFDQVSNFVSQMFNWASENGFSIDR